MGTTAEWRDITLTDKARRPLAYKTPRLIVAFAARTGIRRTLLAGCYDWVALSGGHSARQTSADNGSGVDKRE